MGTINPGIPLDVKVPQTQGPLDLYREGISTQELINAVRLQKQQQAQNEVALQQQQIQAAQQKQQFEDMQVIRQLAPKYSGKDTNGNGTFDFDGMMTEAQSRGVNPQILNQMRMQNYQLQEAASKAGSEKLSNELAHNKAAYEVLEGVKAIDDPQQRQTAYQTGLNRLKLLGMDTAHLPGNAPDNDALTSYETQLGMHGQLIADAKTLADTKKTEAEAAEKEWQKFPELGMLVNTRTGEQRQVSGPVMSPGMLESKYIGIQQKKNMGQPLAPDERAFAKSYEHFKELVPAYNFNLSGGANGGLTPQAIDQQAEAYWQTGKLPPTGRGPAGIAFQRTIMNRANELHPGESLAASSAAYEANKSSLGNLQKQFDSVDAFEKTAIKNIDRAIQTGSQIPDLGARFANIPVRMITGSMIGTENMAKFKADLLTAQTEAAKVLSSATASGVLTDTARKEAQDIVDGNLPYPAMVAAFNELKNDMANRRSSYTDQITEINRRLAGNSPRQNAPSQPRPANAIHTGIGSVDKKKHWLDAKGNDLGLAE